MSEESTTPDLEELEAAFRTILPDGTDWARVVRDDAAWAAYSQTCAALVAPDFIYEDSALPDHAGETYRGLDGLRRAATGFIEPYEEMIYELQRIVVLGDRLVVIHRVRATARTTGIRFDLQAAAVYSYRDGRVVRVQTFRHPDEALKAVGLEE